MAKCLAEVTVVISGVSPKCSLIALTLLTPLLLRATCEAQGGGPPGMTIGDWLIEKGLDAPKTQNKAASSLTFLRQFQVQETRERHAALQGQSQQHDGQQASHFSI